MKQQNSANKIRINAAVYYDLQARIAQGEYAPGEWISVEELCQAYRVSRQPVMEAMRRLSSDWLVEIVPQVGCRVATYDEQSLIDYIQTFGQVEAQVAMLAAERRTESQMERAIDLTARIRRQHEKNPDAFQAGDHFPLGQEYHHLVLEMAHSAVLARLCEQLWAFGAFAYLQIVHGRTREDGERWTTAVGELTEALRLQDRDKARELMIRWLGGQDRWRARTT